MNIETQCITKHPSRSGLYWNDGKRSAWLHGWVIREHATRYNLSAAPVAAELVAGQIEIG